MLHARRWLLLAALALPLSGAEEARIFSLAQSPIRVTAGGSARLDPAPGAPGLGRKLKAIRAETLPAGRDFISVGQRADGGGLFLATPPTMPPGAYTLTFTVVDEADRELRGQVEVVVEPLPPVPRTGRLPVVFVNGFDVGTVLGGGCTLAEDTAGTFGRLEEFLSTDGAPVIFFDNCAFGAPPIEVLGQELGNTISMLQHDDGSPVEQVDVVGFSMGALVVRSYLAGKQLEPGEFSPPADPKIRKAVFVAGEHFGTSLASQVNVGDQLPALRLGSRFLWDLATWHQGFDDLREVDALSVAGTGGTNGQGDGVAPLTGASLAAAAFFNQDAERTRILPACHNDAARPFFCSTSDVIMKVDSEDHPTGRIIRSFFAGTEEWREIGDSPAENSILSTNGGVYFALKDSADAFVSDITRVTAIDTRMAAPEPPVMLEKGQAEVFYGESMPGLPYLFRAERPGENVEVSADIPAGGYSAVLAKLGPVIARAIPAAGLVDTLSVSADSLISIFGQNLALAEEGAPDVFPLPTELGGATVTANGETLGLLYAGPNRINAYLPRDLNGLVKIKVSHANGMHTVNVLIDAAVPAIFAADGSGQGPAAARHALSGELLTVGNPTAIGGLVSLYATGLGETVESGGFQVTVITPEVWVGGVRADVLFAGLAPGFLGLNQINIEIPPGVASGPSVPVTLRGGKRVSNEVTLAIQ